MRPIYHQTDERVQAHIFVKGDRPAGSHDDWPATVILRRLYKSVAQPIVEALLADQPSCRCARHAHAGRARAYERPALRNSFAAFPAASNVA